MLQKTGYRSKSLPSDIALGALGGLETSIWGYAFATIIFSGVLAVFVPVGLFVILIGWALVNLFVAVTSKLRVPLIGIDEQAIVVIGSTGALMVAEMGDGAASLEGLATMLAIMSITSLAVAAGFYLVGWARITRLLELIPYPVICGFMAGIAWLMLDAAFTVAVGANISPDLLPALGHTDNLLKLALYFAGGVALIWFTRRIDRAWALPVGSVAIIALFYCVAWWAGETKASLVAGGWLFDIDSSGVDIGQLLTGLSFSQVRTDFIVTVIPQIATMVFLIMLAAAMALSVLTAVKYDVQLRSADEMKILCGGNLLCALVACPPGYTDEASSILFEKFGASSRWMPIASSCVILTVAFVGVKLVGYMPKALIGASIFLFAIQMMNDWMYANIRKFGLADILIVCAILVIVIFFGFVEGILAGILLTAFIFVLRYSLISAIQGQYTLEEYRSSVERSASSNKTLNRHGGEALVLTLRGYLFFGTTNAIRDAINDILDSGTYASILLDLRRVTGIDVSALQTFQQTKQLCDANGILLIYAGVPDEAREKLLDLGAVSQRDGIPLVFAEADRAIEYMEGVVLAKYSAEMTTGSFHRHLSDLLESDDKAKLVSRYMRKTEIGKGDVLFRQNDPDNGFYILESGALTAAIDDGAGGSIRVKKFSPGSIIGELSSYISDNKRTASVVADESSVLYPLNPADLSNGTPETTQAQSAIHELVARTLSARVDYMNRRLAKEIL